MCKEGSIPLACDAIEKFVHIQWFPYTKCIRLNFKGWIYMLDSFANVKCSN